MLIYILKSTGILAILLLFYKILLERESIHVFKRFFLLASVLLAIIIPAITFTSYVEATPILESLVLENNFNNTINGNSVDYLKISLGSIYILGILFFGCRFLINLYKIFNRVHKNEKLYKKGFIHVLVNSLKTPHTFFNYIFFNKDKYKTRLIPKEVKLHEQTHASQLHSIDVIFIELLGVVFWFNPLIYLLKETIKLNHEFLADEAVLRSGSALINYQNILLEHSYTHNTYPIANAINYSSIKKRFNIMKTKTSPKISWLKSLLLLPLLAFLIYGFSTKKTVTVKQIMPQKEDVNHLGIEFKNQLNRIDTLKINYFQSSKNNESKVNFNQDKATPEQLAEYNKLAKHYNTMSKNEMVVKSKHVKRLKYIYSLMTKEQKASAEPFPNFPPPPPPPPTISKNKTNKGSKELQILSKKFHGKTNEYLKAVKIYNKTKENYEELKPLYDKMMIAYKKFAKKAKEEKLIAPPPPPPVPAKQTGIYNPTYKEYITEVNNKGGRFFFEKNEISYKKALELKSVHGEINMLTQPDNGKPMVFLSRKEITKKDVKVNGKTKDGWSVTGVSNEVPMMDTLPKNAEYYINGKKVSQEKVKALDVDSIAEIHVKKKENKKGAVYITLK